MKFTVLHAGCGAKPIPELFNGWQEIRLDIDPTFYPDVLCSMTDMAPLPAAVVDVVWAEHCLEHLEPDDAKKAAREFHRVLRPGGNAFISVPDLELVAKWILEGKLEDSVYLSPAGPITPLDMLYGYNEQIKGGATTMMHRTGFTAATLCKLLLDVGFSEAKKTIASNCIGIWVRAEK